MLLPRFGIFGIEIPAPYKFIYGPIFIPGSPGNEA
jgi:hypothetical protein